MTDPVKDHVTHLEILREEMELATRRKNDLEKKIEQLIIERDQLNAVLEESSDKILMLEKQTREQDCQVNPSGNGNGRGLRPEKHINLIRIGRVSSISINLFYNLHTAL